MFWLSVAVCALWVCVGIQCAYTAVFWGVALWPARKWKPVSVKSRDPVSIIICARNEAGRLTAHLPLVLAQNYTDAAAQPLYEVVVVNDASDDGTAEVLQELQRVYAHLRVLSIPLDAPREFPGKKEPLGRGVEAARYDQLLFTDADCRPSSADWLGWMAAPLAAGKEIVAGYGGHDILGTTVGRFTNWETMHSFIQWSSWGRLGLPYMAVGRNLACTRRVFREAAASAAWKALPSGDDDLLVNACATADNYAVVSNRDAHTYTSSKFTFAEYARQKQRHLSTGKYYRPAAKALLGLYALTHAGYWVLTVGLLFVNGGEAALYALLLRAPVWILWEIYTARLQEGLPLLRLVAFDPLWAVYNLFFSPYILWKSKQQWT